jgi:hypothetical protein
MIVFIISLGSINAQELYCTYQLDVASPDLKVINYEKIKCKFKTAKDVEISNKAYYHVLLFGKKGKTQMWVIADKSYADAKEYDLMYFDLDYDGIVGEEGELITGVKGSFATNFILKDWKNPSTGEISIAKFYFHKSKYNKKRQSLFAQIDIQGHHTSLYAEILRPNTPKTATKIWIGFEKALTIRNYGKFNKKFYRSTDLNDRNVMISYPGSTNLSCWYLDISYLAKDEHLVTEVEYITLNGEKKKHFGELNKRC